MKYLTFANGDQMPALGLGTWKSEPEDVYNAIKSAVQAGYRHIDCAAIYLNEDTIGKALNDLFKDGIVSREDLWITSKLWCNRHGRKNVLGALEKTLSDLSLDYLDLYLIHWPITLQPESIYPSCADDFIPPGQIPIIDTWRGMEDLQRNGLAKHIGVSNFNTHKLQALIEEAEIAPEMNQIEMHPLLAQNDMLEFCSANNIHLTAYSPLGSRDRNPAFKAANEPNMMENQVVISIAEAKGVSPAQVLIAWAINRGTAVIPKSVNAGRIAENYAASTILLTTAEMDQMAKLDEHFRFLDGSIWTSNGSPYSLEFLWEK